jgi:hypothetical protein
LQDFNHDGHLDIAVCNNRPGVVTVLLNTGASSLFGSATEYVIASYLRDLASGDLNGDGYADLVAVREPLGSVFVLLNMGDGSFVLYGGYFVGASPYRVTLADLTADGALDIVVANTGADDITLLTGNGDGTFTEGVAYTVNSGPNGLAAADFDHDGKMDLAVGNNAVSNVSILLNNFQPGNLVSGFLTFEDIAASAAPQRVTFTFRPVSGGEDILRTLFLTLQGQFNFSGIPAQQYTLNVKGAKYLGANVAVDTTSGDASVTIPTLLAGDANNDNIVDVEDLSALISAFDATALDPNWNGGVADFNGDYIVDVEDLSILIRNFDSEGDS